MTGRAALHSVSGSALRSEGTAPADDPEQDYHDGDNQENMDEAAHGVGSHQPQEPQDDQNDGNGIKHVDILSWLSSNFPDQEGARTDPWTVWGQRLGHHPFSGVPCIKAIFPFEFHRLCAPAYIRRKFFAVGFACLLYTSDAADE